MPMEMGLHGEKAKEAIPELKTKEDLAKEKNQAENISKEAPSEAKGPITIESLKEAHKEHKESIYDDSEKKMDNFNKIFDNTLGKIGKTISDYGGLEGIAHDLGVNILDLPKTLWIGFKEVTWHGTTKPLVEKASYAGVEAMLTVGKGIGKGIEKGGERFKKFVTTDIDKFMDKSMIFFEDRWQGMKENLHNARESKKWPDVKNLQQGAIDGLKGFGEKIKGLFEKKIKPEEAEKPEKASWLNSIKTKIGSFGEYLTASVFVSKEIKDNGEKAGISVFQKLREKLSSLNESFTKRMGINKKVEDILDEELAKTATADKKKNTFSEIMGKLKETFKPKEKISERQQLMNIIDNQGKEIQLLKEKMGMLLASAESGKNKRKRKVKNISSELVLNSGV